ncbi:uncharacterized protein LOC127867922 [Dreissena polymorpha]|uniref:Uncharacterized protein n=1 Tax=Dreissena polymorpha TaxID=45954 RepID=A0A9D4M1B3_DREPO|nr:uncharacterized protein LOC127867922 [Dreissena polymorpha]KAH3869000.1 hypothetical protein DPMN_032156 [Dreissena polymorpha]
MTRADLAVTVFVSCVQLVSSLVIIQPGETDGFHMDTHTEELITLLEGLEKLTDDSVEQNEDSLRQRQNKNEINELQKLLRMTENEENEYNAGHIKLEKKDFAILPPVTEWCRMMGFRRCRDSSAR